MKSIVTPGCQPLWLLLLLRLLSSVDAATADPGLPSTSVPSSAACCTAVSPAYATFEQAVCLISSSSSHKLASQRSAHANRTRPRRRVHPVDGSPSQQTSAATTAESEATAGLQTPKPWLKGSCMASTKGSDNDNGHVFCAYTHTLFAGQGITVITTAQRLETMSTRPVFSKVFSEHDSSSLDDNAAWRDVAIPGKDIGLVAARAIRRGERIMARTPSVMVDGAAVDALSVAAFSEMLDHAASSLPAAHRTQYRNLSTTSNFADGSGSGEDVHKAAYQIFATNAFRTGMADGEPDMHSVFLDVSRINHGCRPNCAYFFDPATLTQSVLAVVDIMPGEELTVGYVDPVQTHAQRAAKLHRHWGFACRCLRCAQLPHLVAESDDRVKSILALQDRLDNYGAVGNVPGPAQAGPAQAELLVMLFELEGLHARIHEAYYRLALEWNGVGDGVRATLAARQCLDRGLLVRGPGQVFVRSMRELVADPTKHWSWRFRVGEGTKGGRVES